METGTGAGVGSGRGGDIIRGFVEPMPEPPRKLPMPRRRFTFSLLFPCAVTTAGGLLFIIHECLSDRPHPVPKPGPRRYPPGYRRASEPEARTSPGVTTPVVERATAD
jgi:hypothetical protein